MNNTQQTIVNVATQALSDAQREQWVMIEEDVPVLAAEYLITTAVARALAKEIAPGLVKVERLIRHAFLNTMMFKHLLDKDSAYLDEVKQGRIDVTVSRDSGHLLPSCLIEIKRELNLPAIQADAARIAKLINCTRPSFDLFGFCLFPLVYSPLPTEPLDYDSPRELEIKKLEQIREWLKDAHPNILVNICYFPEKHITRDSVTEEEYMDGTSEKVWDSFGFRMEPVAIIIERQI